MCTKWLHLIKKMLSHNRQLWHERMQAKIVVFANLMCSAGIEGLYSTNRTVRVQNGAEGGLGTYVGLIGLCRGPQVMYMCCRHVRGKVQGGHLAVLQAVFRNRNFFLRRRLRFRFRLVTTSGSGSDVWSSSSSDFGKLRFRFRLRLHSFKKMWKKSCLFA